MKVIFIVILLVLTTVGETYSQSGGLKPSSDNLVVTTCSSDRAILDLANSMAGKDKLVFIISRLGEKEKKQSLHWKRLKNISSYYLAAWERNEESLIVARGLRVKGFGRVEIYVDGLLLGVLVEKKKGSMDMNCY